MKKTKFIYFDVGGVLVLDFSGTNKWEELKRDIGFTNDNDDDFWRIWKLNAQRVCLDYHVDSLIPFYEKEANIKFTKDYSLLEDIVSRFELNKPIWPLIEKIKNKYRLGLITDMFPGMLSSIRRRKLLPPAIWEIIIDSSEVGFQKPSLQTYELAENMAKVNPTEILYIDNLEGNLIPARNRGWQTFLYDPQDVNRSTNLLEQFLNQK
jgi:FMN phosphatase YigB (HAD superfamily)